MAENVLAPFHGPEGFCPEYKTVIPHPSTSWKLYLGVRQKLKFNISKRGWNEGWNSLRNKRCSAFKEVLLKKRCVLLSNNKKVLFCYKGELILTEDLSQNRDWARGIWAMIDMPWGREFIMKNDAGKTKRFKILSRKSAPCCARV